MERGLRRVLDQYRTEGAQALVTKARLAAAQLLAPPGLGAPAPEPTPAPEPEPEPEPQREDGSHDVLARMCAGVALRDLNLVDTLLGQLEDMEANEGDPDALARLYQLDHLAARLRRNAENLRVLAGFEAGGAATAAVPLVDAIRAAMSAIEQYPRIRIGRLPVLAVVEFAADDLGRLLAELLDNATSQSPPTTEVAVDARLTDEGGVLLRIEDAGIGLPADRLRSLNAQLAAAPKLDSTADERMGLTVVGRLAAKHGVRVSLEQRATHGTVATVALPARLLCETSATSWTPAVTTAPSPAPMAVASPRTPAGAPAGAGWAPLPRVSSEWTGRQEAVVPGGTTRSGLPRRVPHTLRDVAGSTGLAARRDPAPASTEDRGRLMTDLGDFSDGEQAARQVLDEPRVATEHEGRTHDQ